MAKQALGRNLETLLDGKTKDAAKADPAVTPGAPVSSGVRSLMRGNQAPTTTTPATESPRKATVPRWYLLAGDVLLAVMALITLWKSPHPLSWQRELFCAGAVVVGAGLAIVALAPSDK